jgi:hypothetical protein
MFNELFHPSSDSLRVAKVFSMPRNATTLNKQISKAAYAAVDKNEVSDSLFCSCILASWFMK